MRGPVVRGRGFRARIYALTVCAVAMLVGAPFAHASTRDDTVSLQSRLDAGGTVFLPKLQNGRCYATRGLWVSRDGTSITSDGACIVALGPGEARVTGGGRPIRARSVFLLNHSSIFDPLPVRITISGLRIVVPAAKRMAGISIFGHEVTLDHVTIAGSPTTDVVIGSGKAGSAGMSERIAIHDCSFAGGKRDVVSAFGPIGLRLERNTLAGARNRNAAGLHIRAADRGQPTLDVHVLGNRIIGNAGPGILLDVDPKNGAPVLASGIELGGNEIRGNGGAGIVLAGGQADRRTDVSLADNAVRANGGPGLLGRHLRFVPMLARNDLRGNHGGPTRGLRVRAAPAKAPGARWTPDLAAAGGARDDTKWLQSRLDARGGTIFLPKLANGECYATHGLWVSRDDTTITSDGACIVSLGPGEVRLHSIDGDPIASTAVFYVSRSRLTKPAPAGITISNLRIVVPSGQTMYGVAIFGHAVTLSHLDIGGAPKDDVLIGNRANGNGYAGNVSVLDSTLSDAGRNAVSAFGVIGLRIEGNTIQGVRDSPAGQPAAGIDIEPDDRGQPTLGLHIVHNMISDNAGPGIMLELDSNSGPAVIATELEISGNTIVRNALKRTPPKRAGIVIAGGQDGGGGTLLLKDNVIRDNGGPGILGTRLKLVVEASGNDLSGNEGGSSTGFPSGLA